MKDGAKILGYVAKDVTDIIEDVLNNAPLDGQDRVSAALGGTSLALVRCAYDLGIPAEYLKERICGDITEIYATEDAIKAAELQ